MYSMRDAESGMVIPGNRQVLELDPSAQVPMPPIWWFFQKKLQEQYITRTRGVAGKGNADITLYDMEKHCQLLYDVFSPDDKELTYEMVKADWERSGD